MKYVREIFDMIFDMIFSAGTFFLLLIVGFFYLILHINEVEELRQKEAAYCYSQNMIVVKTDAGRHCAPASSLTAIK
jgi:hypothetical protein